MRLHFHLALVLAALAGTVEAATVPEAQAAFGRFDINQAQSLYEAVLNDPLASAEDKAVAQREIARVTWLVDGNAGEAAKRLEASLRTDPDPCPAARLYGRILNDSLSPDKAREKIEPFAQRCLWIEPGVAMEALRSLLREARAAKRTALQVTLANRALAAFETLPGSVSASADGSRLRLSLGILARNPAEAMEGWRAYFWLPEGRLAVPGLGLGDDEIHARFRDGLTERPHRPEGLATLLMKMGFLEQIKDYLAVQPDWPTNSHNSKWRTVSAYLAFRERLDPVILAHDRAYARGRRSAEASYEDELSSILTETARIIRPGGGDHRDILREEFGLWGTDPGKSNGVSGIHLGHVADDRALAVEQDGRTGKIRLIVLDNMVHNSFSSWLMDGASGVGGWAVSGDTIVQVRPRYLLLIDDYSRLARPGPALDRAFEEIRGLRITDREIARNEPISFLPGVRASLRLRGIQAIDASLGQGASTEDRSRRFRLAYWNALIASSITAHEGRHVLDQAQFGKSCPLADEELEYRAKLSEIRFAPVPQIALSSIFSPLFGGASGHGKANQRIMRDYAEWIEQHSAQIPGYRQGLSALEQLDLLTPSQLVEVAQELEPTVAGTC